MKRLLAFTAIIEAATGLALLAVPAVVVRLLLGGEISAAEHPARPRGRLGLLSLGMACWPRRKPSRTAPALRAMLTYNSLVTLYLFTSPSHGEWVGPLLWPAVALHGILSLLLARQWRVGNMGQ